MIKCDMGIVSYSSPKAFIKADLTVLMTALKREGILSEDDIKQCYTDSLKSDEEMEKEVAEKIEHIEDMIDVLSAIVNKEKVNEEKLIRVIKGFHKE